ncbi:MAG: hypothetical protein SH850_11380 [Planctomycetaceae bacterium]|nr:hypothetical protein [Planctomycetaceae bacterium]
MKEYASADPATAIAIIARAAAWWAMSRPNEGIHCSSSAAAFQSKAGVLSRCSHTPGSTLGSQSGGQPTRNPGRRSSGCFSSQSRCLLTISRLRPKR